MIMPGEVRLQTPVLLNYKGVAAGQRALDVGLAGTGLIVLAAMMLVIILFIWLESGPPIFFSQVRIGQYGRPFRLYKFRKFRPREMTDGAAVTVNNDRRLTRVGRVLVRTKLDELPQLWNILKGDMSVVGPRPETMAFADCFDGGYRGVLAFRPGIFGPNQVFFRNEGALFPSDRDPEQFYRDVLFPLKGRVDLAYFPQRNTGRDIAWIVRGILAVFQLTPMRGQKALVFDQVESWVRQHGLTTAPVTQLCRNMDH